MCVICELTELKNLKPKKNQWPHGMTICDYLLNMSHVFFGKYQRVC